ncbi:MAG: FHA domain-containing protein [Nitrospinaceae bacterium]
MRIQFIVEKISLKGLKERLVKDFDQPEVIIGRGSGADILLSSRMVAFRHARLVFRDNNLILKEIDPRGAITRVNDQVTKKTILSPGDRLVIGDTQLTVSQEKGIWQIVEVRRELTKEEEELRVSQIMDWINICDSLPSAALMSLVLIIPVVLIYFAAPLLGAFETTWSSGPLSSAHQFLETDCKACHTQAFTRVSDEACSKCHKMGEHSAPLAEKKVAALPLENKCRTCHREHISGKAMVLEDLALCVNCHGSMRELLPDSTSPSIEGFDSTHPEFALIKNLTPDRAKIKLNHRYHLTSIEVDDAAAPGGKRAMRCQDCHVPGPASPAGGYMQAISFAESCSGCHKLSVGSAAAMLRVPHEKPQLVRTFLNSPQGFLDEYIHENPGDLTSAAKASSRRSRRKKAKPVQKTKREWVQGKFKKIAQRGGLTPLENKIFFSAKGGCVECHFLDVEPVAAVSPDSLLAAFSLWDNAIRVWDFAAAQEKFVLRGHEDVVHAVQFDPAGHRLLSGSRDFTARIWNLEDPEAAPLIFKKHLGAVNSAAFSPAGGKIITGSDDATAIIWDIGGQQPLHLLQGHDRPVVKVAMNRAGDRALTLADDGRAILWDVAGGQPLADFNPAADPLLTARFSPDGTLIAGGLANGSIQVWNAQDGQGWAVLPPGTGSQTATSGHVKPVTGLVFSPDGLRLISLAEDFSAKIWNLRTRQVLVTLTVPAQEDEKPGKISPQLFLTAAFNQDGSQVVTGSSDKMVRVWDSRDGKLLAQLKGNESPVPAVFFAGEGSKIMAAALNNTATIWDLKNQERKTLRKEVPAAPGDGEESLEPAVQVPQTLPSQIPNRFFFKGRFNHLKHEYLSCEVCHAAAAKSVSTLDMLLPPVRVCRTCHEKDQIHLNNCVECHSYHPEKKRGFMTGRMELDPTAPLGYHLTKQ